MEVKASTAERILLRAFGFFSLMSFSPFADCGTGRKTFPQALKRGVMTSFMSELKLRPPDPVCCFRSVRPMSFSPGAHVSLSVRGRGAALTEQFLRADCGCRRGGRCACAGQRWARARSLA